MVPGLPYRMEGTVPHVNETSKGCSQMSSGLLCTPMTRTSFKNRFKERGMSGKVPEIG
jgi:hypothetical protein